MVDPGNGRVGYRNGESHVTGALRYTLLWVLQSAWLGQVWQAARWGEARRKGYFAEYELEFRETEGGAERGSF